VGSAGQGLVEFALVFPIIALLVVAFIDMGRAVWSYTEITNAAREGARVASVNQLSTVTDCDETRPIEDPANAHWTIRGCVITVATPLGLTNSNITVAYSPPPTTTLTCSPTIHVGCIASVTVTYAYSPSTPIVSGFIHAITFSSTSQMPVERVFP
jgi:Flp pilus assembly protein TadG